MAGERKGKAYEALIILALKEIAQQGWSLGDVYWNVKPPYMSMVPDITIGHDGKNPTHILLITHSNTSNNSNMKFWRNIFELWEAKTKGSGSIAVITVAFDSIIKENLKKIQNAAFDSQMIIGHSKSGRALIKGIDSLIANIPINSAEKVNFLKEAISLDKYLKSDFEEFCRELRAVILNVKPNINTLWALEGARERPTCRKAKNTSIRRGLCKLLIFEDHELAIDIFSGIKIKASRVPEYAFSLKLVGRTVGNVVPLDDDISSAVRLLGKNPILELIQKVDLSEMKNWLALLRNSAHLNFMGSFVLSRIGDLSDPVRLHAMLLKVHKDPGSFAENLVTPANWPPSTVWLAEFIFEVIKAKSGRANGYGQTQAAKEIIEAGFGSIEDMTDAGQFGGGFGLSAWLRRDPSSQLRADLVQGLSFVLAKRMKSFEGIELANAVKLAVVSLPETIIEQKLVTSRTFDPLGDLLKQRLRDFEEISVRSCFAEAAGVTGAASKTKLIRIGESLVNWQSATDSGRMHKRKELCGRAVGIRYTWDQSANQYRIRPRLSKLILLLDGEWEQDDLNALTDAGWDEIFFADELDSVVKSISTV